MLEVGGHVGASLPVHSLPLRGPPSFEVKSGAGRRDGRTRGRQTPTKEIGGNSESGEWSGEQSGSCPLYRLSPFLPPPPPAVVEALNVLIESGILPLWAEKHRWSPAR